MLGDNIARLRRRRGMSQQALADEMHVVRQTISKWEKSLSVPDADALVRLADALETTVQELLGTATDTDNEAVQPDIAGALTQINAQLAIQNRRRNRIWKAVAWLFGLFMAFNVLMLVLGWAYYSADVNPVHEETMTFEQVDLPAAE